MWKLNVDAYTAETYQNFYNRDYWMTWYFWWAELVEMWEGIMLECDALRFNWIVASSSLGVSIICHRMSFVFRFLLATLKEFFPIPNSQTRWGRICTLHLSDHHFLYTGICWLMTSASLFMDYSGYRLARFFELPSFEIFCVLKI